MTRFVNYGDTDLLDEIATRILAEDRNAQGITRIADYIEQGFQSRSQYERRRKREVYSSDAVSLFELTSLSHEEFWRGVFGRSYRKTRQPWHGGDPIKFWGDEE